MNVTIVIPTYNERNNVQTLIGRIFSIVPDVSVLVVDDTSPDGTADAVKALEARYPNLRLLVREKKEGLGKAYAAAFDLALEDLAVTHVVMMDADLSHDPAYLPDMFAIADRYDVVVGSRYTRGGNTEGWEMWRRVLSRYGNLYARVVTRLPVHDCTGGYNLMRASSLRSINRSFDASGYAFIMELKYRLYRAGARFAEVPIIFKNRTDGESKISGGIIKEGIIAPWEMVLRRRS